MDRDRQGNGYSTLTSPPPRPEDRVDAPGGASSPGDDAIRPPTRRFARPGAPATPLAPPPRPAQAADTLFMPPPSAADRVAAGPDAATVERPAIVLPPPDAAHRVIPPPEPGYALGAAAFPPPFAEHRVPPAAPPRTRRLAVPGPAWLGPALLAALGVLLIGAGIGFGAHAIFGGKHHKKVPAAQATPSRRTPVPLTPTTPTGPTTPPSGPATVSPGGATPGKSKAIPLTPPVGKQSGSGPSAAGGGISSWPAGKTAWTVVLASTTNRGAAESKAHQASGRGIQAGVLNSSDYSSLRHGYWVTFAGQYGSSGDAAAAAKRYAGEGFGGAYARLVKP